MSKSSETVFDSCYNKVKSLINGQSFNVSNWINLVVVVMQCVDKITTIRGPEKKDLAIKIIVKLVGEIPFENEDDRNNITLIINASLPTIIDTVVSVSNGQLLLNVKSCFKKIRKLFSCWC